MRFRLKVESAPYWIVQPTDTTTVEGGTAEFACAAGGIPAPTVFRFVNDVPITQVPASANRVLRNGTVYLRNVGLDETMKLQCNASNKHGYVFADVYLNVLLPPSFVRPPLAVTYAAEQQ